MARLSDIIEGFIKELLEETESSEVEIGRNELANHFSCSPSQINYVLSTRFSNKSGYYVESRRGGGGYIKVTKLKFENNEPLIKIIEEKIDDSVTYETARLIIKGFLERGLVSERENLIMMAALNDRTLDTQDEDKNKLRSKILKAMLRSIFL